jgi:hypothetical protein
MDMKEQQKNKKIFKQMIIKKRRDPPVFKTPVPHVSNVGAMRLMVSPPLMSMPTVFWKK